MSITETSGERDEEFKEEQQDARVRSTRSKVVSKADNNASIPSKPIATSPNPNVPKVSRKRLNSSSNELPKTDQENPPRKSARLATRK